ncbi:hypothetical protein EI427_25770 (plasmid) [Flammeovirga pectinis]|uniref:Glycosyl transferase family 28 C-terminal domain-containing protein n=1 Tax=Flammeovirga pectinis TaxID=2494373 RepID=A0A3S9PBP0_9BACT|nr:glycosyltransferase [Flammeovirga pectinis]AZQ65646.1 hypothetical protein EI427_25770 [Flammeovirga pectinis]
MSKKILFRIFPQESHHNATFTFAKILQQFGVEVIYMAISQMEGIVKQNGFKFIALPYEKDIMGKPSERIIGTKMDRLKQILPDLLIERRVNKVYINKITQKDFFEDIINEVNPDIIILDGTYKANIFHSFKYGIPIVILETTVSLINQKNKPPLSSSLIPANNVISELLVKLSWKKYHLKSYFLSKILGDVSKPVKELSKLYPKINVDYSRYFFLGYSNILELNSTIYEFDFDHDRPKNIFYLGPPSLSDRNNMHSDLFFKERFWQLKKEYKKIVYCSFGTMAWRYKNHESFIDKVLKYFYETKGIALIICIEGQLFRHKMREKYVSDNIVICRRVPQIYLLKASIDLMITHGGINSINECILTNTPMLVYPGAKNLDQTGNGARVKYHGLGERGTLKDSYKSIKKNIQSLLNNEIYKKNLLDFNDNINPKNYINLKDFLKHMENYSDIFLTN